MTIAGFKFSRRTFLLSGAAGLWASSLPLASGPSPLPVHAIGWGRHGRRFQAAVECGQLSVLSVLEPNPRRARMAYVSLCSLQAQPPTLHGSFSSFARALARTASRAAALLCSPPDSWITLLNGMDSKQPVLAYHSDAFSALQKSRALRALDRAGERVFLLGLDPGWPRASLASFYEFARSRGVISSAAMLEHVGWSDAEVSAFQFDLLDSTHAERGLSRHSLQVFACPVYARGARNRPSSCLIKASTGGLTFEAGVEIRSGAGFSESSQTVELFRTFAEATSAVRWRAVENHRRILEHVLSRSDLS